MSKNYEIRHKDGKLILPFNTFFDALEYATNRFGLKVVVSNLIKQENEN